MELDYKVGDTSQSAVRSDVAHWDFIVSCALGGVHDANLIQYLADAHKRGTFLSNAIVTLAHPVQLYNANRYSANRPYGEYHSFILRGTQIVDEHDLLSTGGWVQNKPLGAFEEGLGGWSTVQSPSHGEIFANLSGMGLEQVASRLTSLKKMADEDTNEPSMQLKSLQNLAQFLISERWLKQPRIGLSPDGLLQIEWLLNEGGLLAIWFLVDGRVQFAAVEGKTQMGTEANRVSGVFRKDDMLRAVLPFTRGLVRE